MKTSSMKYDAVEKPMMPTDVSIITTYRCQMRCKMCNIWEHPTNSAKELTPKDYEKLPSFKFVNITGGEPFVRRDLDDIVEVMRKKSDRIVISTSGYHQKRIFKLAERFPNIGIRVSIEGLSQINDDLRGRKGGFDRGLQTVIGLREMGIKDVGFGCTVSNQNSGDMLWLYELSKTLNMEFATATFHNSYYFHRDDNVVDNQDQVIDDFHELIERLLKQNHPKAWFRAFFNLGLINYIRGEKRMLPCQAGTVNFFVEPYGDIYPCNGLEDRYWKESMGNLKDVDAFKELWFSDQARKVRQLVATCPKNCWMVGTAAPVMRKYISHPAKWVIKNKLKSMLGKPICVDEVPCYDVGQNPLQGDLRIDKARQFLASGAGHEYTLSKYELEDMLADE